MASTLCCSLNEIHTLSCKPKQFFRAGFVLKIRNLGICQLGVSRNGGSKSKLLSTSTRKYFSVGSTEGLVSVVEEEAEEEEEEEEEDSFTVSYLMNSCGLAPELAISASKKVKFSTSEKPDLVLGVLREYGFESEHIAYFVINAPSLLLARPKITLIPRLDYFRSLGFNDNRLGYLCSSNPKLFRLSLKNRIIPICNFLRSVLLDDKRVRASLTGWGSRSLFDYDVQLRLSPNVNTLGQKGVASNVIWYTMTSYPCVIVQKSDKFVAGVEELIRLGFNPARFSFVHALYWTIVMTKADREKIVKAYKSWGCSDDDIAVAYRKYPLCMLLSEKKLMEAMNFLVKELGLELTDIMRSPSIVTFSLKGRLIPRCSVVRLLQLKGLKKKRLSLGRCIQIPPNQFLEEFVAKYKRRVPQLVDVYRGKVGLRDLGFGPEEIRRIVTM